VDAGMPVVLIAADSLGVTGRESPSELEADEPLTRHVEELRLLAGQAMGFGDVTDSTVPKMSILSPAVDGGSINTRTFIPHRVHTSIGVLGAVSVAAGSLMSGSVGAPLLQADGSTIRIEHPTGFFDVEAVLNSGNGVYSLRRSAVIRTARKLFDGTVWPRKAEA
jgi:4-oxalomesaconate tautomerase